jgi:hypothetical protein
VPSGEDPPDGTTSPTCWNYLLASAQAHVDVGELIRGIDHGSVPAALLSDRHGFDAPDAGRRVKRRASSGERRLGPIEAERQAVLARGQVGGPQLKP